MATELPIVVTTDASQAERELRELGEAGEAAGASIAAGIGAGAKRAESDVRRATSGASRSLDQVGGAAEKLGAKLGGPFGEAADLVFDFLGPLGSASTGLGGMAGAVAGVGVASLAAVGSVGLLLAGARGLADAAIAARDRLEEQGLASQIPEASLVSLKRYETGAETLQIALDELTVTIGSEFAGHLAVLATRLADVVEWTSSWVGSLREASDAALSVITLGLADHLLEYRDEQEAATLATVDQTRAEREWADAERDALIQLGILIPDVEHEGDARRRAADAARAQAAELAALTALNARWTQDQATAYLQALGQEAELIALYTREGEYFSAARASEADYRETQLQYIEEVRSAQALAVADMIERDQERQTLALSHAEELLAVSVDVTSQLLAQQATLQQATLDRLVAEAQADGEVTDEEARRIRVEFQRLQAYQRGLAIIDAARAAVGFAASLSFLTPALAIPLALGAAGALLAGQLAIIDRQEPPSFPTGLTPDHHDVRIQRGEGIASRRAMSMPEVRQAIERGNEGLRPSGSSSSTVRVLAGLDPRSGQLRVHSTPIGKRSR